MATGQSDSGDISVSRLSFSPVTQELIERYSIPVGSTGAVILPKDGGDGASALEGAVVSRVESDRFERFVTSPDELASGIESIKGLGDRAASFRVLGQDNRYRWVRVNLTD